MDHIFDDNFILRGSIFYLYVPKDFFAYSTIVTVTVPEFDS